ncbi:MAG: glycosyltransferase family 4 protein [Planctomycetes bacterium]|nr:glycosyltransferase family 4 protein [Planctomycetota bacterium]
MRVLLWNRPNAESAPGGDTVQWRRTAAALETLGVEVECTLESAQALDLSGFDLVHVFNLQSEVPALAVAERARAAGLPVALSTIWWDLSEGRYLRRLRRKRLLRLREQVIGREASLARFLRWDRARPRGRRRDAAAANLLGISQVLLPNSVREIEALEAFFQLEGLALKSAVVCNGASVPRGIEPAPDREGVLCVARLGPLKNQLALIEACRGLAPLTLVGPSQAGDYLSECQAAAADHGACQILPARPQHELWPLYAGARVHALASFRETPGLVSLEAAALGCALVSTDRGSAEEYLGEEAEYCDPTDTGSIRAALERALAEPRRVSPERLASYTWERAGAATLIAYRWLLGEPVELPSSLAGPPSG